MFTYWINDVYYKDQLNENATIFQKCSQKGLDLPCFCYHENLSIAGNCRMCLVEVNTSLKLVVSCAMPMQNNIKIYTSNYRIKKAREAVLEFLLVNHPLDCPICDQGGECDLQDITLVYGSDRSRFYEYNKRSVFDKECGPFVKMIMTRCIHCTRCVRFLSEVTDSYEYGMINRGSNSEISTFVKDFLGNELSGNIIDLCPVGALTSKPFAFTARPWELNSMESIDIFDSMASSIRVDYLNNRIYRVLPVYDKYINEDWITNKIRFAYDSQRSQRINYPLLKVNDRFVNLSWNFIIFVFFYKFVYFFTQGNIKVFFGDFCDLNALLSFKKIFDFIGVEVNLVDNFIIDSDFRNNFITNFGSYEFSTLFIVGLNFRVEFPLLNSKLKRIYRKNNFRIFSFFSNFNDNFGGNNIFDLVDFTTFRKQAGLKNFFFKSFFTIFNFGKNFLNLNIVFGLNFFRTLENYFIKKFFLDSFFYKCTNLQFNVLVSNLSYINFYELGFRHSIHGNEINFNQNNLIMMFNVDTEVLTNILSKKFINKFVVYAGSFFDEIAKLSDMIFPVNFFFEYSGLFVNFEGTVRKSAKVVTYNTNIYNAADLFKSIFVFFNFKFIKFNFLLKNFSNLFSFFKQFSLNWGINANLYKDVMTSYVFKKSFCSHYFNVKNIKNQLIGSLVYNYYKNDVVSRNSRNLNLASIDYINKLNILD